MSVDTHGIIPTSRLADAIRPVVARLGPTKVAAITGLAERRIYAVMVCQYPNCSLQTADTILTRLEMVDLWHLPPEHGGLADVYPDWPDDGPRPPWERARALRAEGWSYPRIGREFGVHHTTVMYWCDDYYRRRKNRLEQRRYQKRADSIRLPDSAGAPDCGLDHRSPAPAEALHRARSPARIRSGLGRSNSEGE